MPRPRICRRVSSEPRFIYFKPRGVPLRNLEEVKITVDELEAIRLADLEEIDQKEAAKKMNISQPTLHRIVRSSRKKITDALANGKAIRIEGGDYSTSNISKFKCYTCGNSWEEPYSLVRIEECSKCSSANISRASNDCDSRYKAGL